MQCTDVWIGHGLAVIQCGAAASAQTITHGLCYDITSDHTFVCMNWKIPDTPIYLTAQIYTVWSSRNFSHAFMAGLSWQTQNLWSDLGIEILVNSVFKIRSETCRTVAQFFQNLYMIKKESLPDRPKFCRSGSAVRHLFWRLLTHWLVMAPAKCSCKFEFVIFQLIPRITIFSFFCAITIRRNTMTPHWRSSTLAQVMSWCHQAASHYLGQC